MKNDTLENRLSLANNRLKIPDAKLLMGSTKGKYPVILDDGKTIIYISDKSKEAETRLKYELLRNSRFPSHSAKSNS
jgi:hypothetical protein